MKYCFLSLVIAFGLLGFLSGVSAGGVSAFNTGSLDRIATTPVAAYSLRQLKGSYTGAAITVRRAADDATSDIYFTSTGELDTSTLLTFCSTDSCFVTTWFDQSGNAKNAIETNPSMQPSIVSSGMLDESGGHPSLVFSGNQTFDADWGSGYTEFAHTAVYSRDNTTWPFGSLYHQGPGWSTGWIHAIESNGPFALGFNGENFTQTAGPGSASSDGMTSAFSAPI